LMKTKPSLAKAGGGFSFVAPGISVIGDALTSFSVML
jgi:hypothetical protein